MIFATDAALVWGEDGPATAERAADGLPPFPCLNSNNSIIDPQRTLTPYGRKTAFSLTANIGLMAERHGVEKLVFGTLGFEDPEQGDTRPNPNFDRKEAQRRFNSLNSNLLKGLFSEIIVVPERGSKSGRLHFHMLAAYSQDIRTGVDFEAIGRGDYRSAPKALRDLWAIFRDTKGGQGKARAYGFGRTEWLPVKSTAEGISKYVGKYIGKQFEGRKEEDKGMRLVRYTQGANNCRCSFAWNSPRARLWRRLVAQFAREMGIHDLEHMSQTFGSRWAFNLRDRILSRDLVVERESDLELAEIQDCDRHLVAVHAAKAMGITPEQAYWDLFQKHRYGHSFGFDDKSLRGDDKSIHLAEATKGAGDEIHPQ